MDKKTLVLNLNNKQKEYDYSLIKDKFSYNEEIKCICHSKDLINREHGIFKTTFGHLLRGDGCPKCSGKYMDKELFIYESKLIHGNDYSYDESVFLGKKKKLNIYCKKHKIYFPQTPEKHLSGHGCPICRHEKAALHRMKTLDEFIVQSKLLHNGKYDTSKAVYRGRNEKLILICHKKDGNGKEHGEFEITPANHLHKTNPQGCPICGRISASLKRIKTFDNFQKEANIVHSNKYKYIRNTYINASSFVDIICPIHGLFKQKGTDHICLKQGCPKCSNQMSLGEEEIINYINVILPNEVVERRNRCLIHPQELDIVIRKHNIAIEFNGIIWHSSKFGKDKDYHLNKTLECSDKGIKLIHIFEDEWNFKRDIVKSMLAESFDVYEETIDAKDCYVREISASVARDFLNANDIDGYRNSKYKYGLYAKSNDLVSVITFDKKCNIISFSNKLHTNVINALRTLIRYFTEQYAVNVIKVSLNRRFCVNKQFIDVGFKHIEYTKPNRFYVDGKNRVKVKPNNGKECFEIYDCGNEIMEMNMA